MMHRAHTLITLSAALRLSLTLGPSALLGCASAPPRATSRHVTPSHTIIVHPVLDLSARQDSSRAWLQELIDQSNEQLQALNVTLKLAEERPWELTDQRSAEALESLWSALASELKASSADLGSPHQALWLGINSAPPPSYPSLAQLGFSRKTAPLVILRRLNQLSGVAPDIGLKAMARLLAREVGASLGALRGCTPDTMSLTRDELLGWRIHHEPSPQEGYQGARHGSPTVKRATPRRHAPEPQDARERSSEHHEQARLVPLTWSPLNQRLTALTLTEGPASGVGRGGGHCARLELLELSCQETLSDAKLYTHGCLKSAQDWREASERGSLPEAWRDERSLAEGARALLSHAWAQAIERCAPVASVTPSSFASRCAGTAAAELGRDEEAQRYLRAYLAAHPVSPEVILLLSKVIGRGGDHRAAEALLSELLSHGQGALTPRQRARALYNLGVARAQLGRLEEARHAWLEVQESGGEHYRKARALLEELDAP